MTVDVTFKSGATNSVVVKVKEINWDMNLGPITFSPATLKIIGDVFETDTGDLTDSGTHTGADNAAVLTDSTQSWVADQWVGRTINNTTDASSATITANTATTITGALGGGAQNDWDKNDVYAITTDTTDRKMMNFILDFGKMSELVTFTVTFSSDEAWYAFHKFAGEGAYFDKTVANPIHFYWGGNGDPFYLNANNLTNLGEKYEGTFTKVNVTQKVPTGIWEGTVKFAIGKVMQI